jgi:16S rRNA (adenine1518-N6/adenine1519-N6)-dimethyltransferase
MDRKTILEILAVAGMSPRHHFGQHFMIDQNILRAIAAGGGIEPGDVVLEVGPGVGNLTALLAEQAKQVLAVDIDRDLIKAAAQHHRAMKNITWLNMDILAGKHAIAEPALAALRELGCPPGACKLVSNLPYNAASPMIAELLALGCGSKPQLLVKTMSFTVQWEVGCRMASGPGTHDFGSLGVWMQSCAKVEILRKIPPGAFWPPPKIDSALVRVTADEERMAQIEQPALVQRALSGLFAHRRQKIRNALEHVHGKVLGRALTVQLAEAGFPTELRAGECPAVDLLALCQRLITLTEQPQQ